jgi:hypothetical protein
VSVAPKPWPEWVRRHTALELLGTPGLFFAKLTIALSLGAILYVGAWNAAKYPISLGYDAEPNIFYSHFLLDQHHIPTPEQSGESNQPPAYYFIAGVAARFGLHWPFNWREARPFKQLPEASYRGAQILNVALVFLTALCVLWLAWLVAPERPWVWAASVGFFAFLPVVSKTEAMFHPENLNMLMGAVAVASATAMFVSRRITPRLMTLLIGSLVVGLATRASTVFVVLAVVLGAAVAVSGGAFKRFARWRFLWIGSATLAVVGLAWVSFGVIQNHRIDAEASRSHFFRLSPAQVFGEPWRPNMKNEAFDQTYTDIWGDWFSAFSWSVYAGPPPQAAQAVLKDQSIIGVIPTALALVGWLGIASAAVRRRRDLVIVAALPLIATAGYLVRSWLTLTKDGDLFKATYLLNTAPVWALSFGLATAWLASRSRLGRYTMVALFAAFAVLELRFTMYGIRDNAPIF